MIYDTLNPEIVKFIIREARNGIKILDVGCGTGRLGEVLKDKISCYITGIELNKDAVDSARKHYDEVFMMNLEDIVNNICKFENKTKYNYIVFGDILEHVTKPQVLLQCFAHILENDGFIIASIPNIANWMIRIRLLFGNFDYSGGILDIGHLKFFTYKSAKRLLEDSGYKIISVTNNNQTWLFKFLGRCYKKLFAFQFVFKCRKVAGTSSKVTPY